MGVMDKFLTFMSLNDEEEYIDEDYLDDEDEIEEPAPRKSAGSRNKEEEPYEERSSKKSQQTKVTSIRPVANNRRVPGSGMEVCVVKPTSIDEAREITETLLANRTVVLNLEGLDVDIAQRIIDFTSGSCYAINGNLQKISHYIFIITPASVDISGDFQDLFTGSFEAPPFNNGL